MTKSSQLLAWCLPFALAGCSATHGEYGDPAGRGGGDAGSAGAGSVGSSPRGGAGGGAARGGTGGATARGGTGGATARGGTGGVAARGGSGGVGARGGAGGTAARGGTGGTTAPLSCEDAAVRNARGVANLSDRCTTCMCDVNADATRRCTGMCWKLIDCLFESGCATSDTACIRAACVAPLGGMASYNQAAMLASDVPFLGCRAECFPPDPDLDAGR